MVIKNLEPVSVNRLWKVSPRGGIYLDKKAKNFKELFQIQMKSQCNNLNMFPTDLYRVSVEFIYPKDTLYTKAGVIRKIDLDNMLKLTLDSAFEFLGVKYGVDDSQIVSITASKTVGEHVEIRLSIAKEL